SRPPASTRRPDVTSTTSSTGCRTSTTPRSCSPRTTSTRPRSSPTASSSCPAAGSPPTAARTPWPAGSPATPRCAGAATASTSCTPPRTRPASSAACSSSTGPGSPTWKCAGRPWRTPTWPSSRRRKREPHPARRAGGTRPRLDRVQAATHQRSGPGLHPGQHHGLRRGALLPARRHAARHRPVSRGGHAARPARPADPDQCAHRRGGHALRRARGRHPAPGQGVAPGHGRLSGRPDLHALHVHHALTGGAAHRRAVPGAGPDRDRGGRLAQRRLVHAPRPAVRAPARRGHRRHGHQPAGRRRDVAADRRRAHRDIRDLLPDHRAGRLAAGPGPRLPALLARPRHALGAAARRGRRRGDRRLVASGGDHARPARLGRGRPGAGAAHPAPDGPARVRVAHGAAPPPRHAEDRLRRWATMSETVYNRIALLRAERGVTRRQLAEALGVHYQTIGYLERGEYSPSLYLALRIAEYFEVPVEVVFSTKPFPRIGERTA